MSITKMRKSFGSGKVLRWIMGFIGLVFVVGCFTAYNSYSFNGGRGGRETDSSVVATVNGEPIPAEELQNAVKSAEKQQEMMTGSRTMGVMQRASLMSQKLDELIDRRLRLQEAKKEGLEVSNRAIDSEIDKIAKQQTESLKSYVMGNKDPKKVSDEDLDRELAKLNSDNIPKSVSAIRDNLDTREMRGAIENELLIQALDKKAQDSVKPMTDAQLIDSYKRVRARHILVKTVQGQPEEQLKRKAEEILNKVKSGGDFAALARQYSDDPGSKNSGGDLGYFGQGQMVAAFDKAAFSMKPGQISDLVKTPFGFHIIKVEDQKIDLPKDFEKNKKNYRDSAMAMKRQEASGKFYQGLKKSAKVDIRDPFLAGMHSMQMAYQDPAQTKKYQTLAMSSFNKAIAENPNEAGSYAMLSLLHMQNGDKAKAKKMLEDVLDVKGLVEDADLRMQLGRLYQEDKQVKEAVKQYGIASEYGYNDIQIHFQLQSIYKELNRPDLAAKEEKYVKDYTDRMKAEQAKRMPQPAPAEKGEKPKAGG